nr:helix-turn-helix transcriptional regulator [uncultured Schaedlerella sp.]
MAAKNQQKTIDNIRRLIRAKGLKQTFVAEQAGLTDQQLTDILNNRRLLRVEHLEPLARTLGVTIETLIS